ncbi:saccharopine dehydrogenase NADP-binding domain-containing protein [Kitasatospora viridis]|uniref:Saccharopine dehydrogenase-like protein n=1 Tax=Kitasatospora viridis TaxID=281105 RepID=A0A561T628_9ACTN|nr:saccharopine dehydrogenase NADP-binding domain-containing protein [Kitasatospora viridis]TWF82564.1 saccharopine dehydrogenase-like protein [Kitasatospora viridis]
MIGVLGGYGAVGSEAARLLAAWGIGPLRIGGRDEERARASAAALPGPAEGVRVDLADDASLEAFVHGCDLVVNCAGPSHRTAARVARAALAVGAHHVDAGGDGVPEFPADRSVVLAAGAVPGLSGLLPRRLAAEFTAVHRLTAHTAVFDRFTPTAAADYLHGVLGGGTEPLAAWQDGRRRSRALPRRPATRLPHLPREVTATPYLDAEAERLAHRLGLAHGYWYSLLDGEQLPAALEAARTLPLPEAVRRLCRATALDTAGRTPYLTLLVQLDGTIGGRAATRTAVLRAPGVARLTGAVTAAAVPQVLAGRVPPGARPAAEVLDPAALLEQIGDHVELTIHQTTIDQLALVEEGAL